MTLPLVHFAPIAPALSGNGLAMRTGIFADALSQVAPSIVVSIGDDQSASWRWSGHGGRHVHIQTLGRGHTPLDLISRITDSQARAAALRAHGRPMASYPFSAPVISDAMRSVGSCPVSAILISRARLLPVLDHLPREWQAVPVIVDLDDDDAALCHEQAALARTDGDQAQADLMQAEADAYDSLIRKHASRVSCFVCASEAVAKTLVDRLDLCRVEVIRNGIARPAEQPMSPARKPQNVIFVGNLSYQPNIDGVVWFISKGWQRLSRQLPEARLMVVGSNPSDAIRRACTAPTVELYPDPEHLGPLYAKASVAVVPLRLGSGSRIKILEAAMFALPVVSTPKGVEGLDADLVSAIKLAETPELLAQACADALRSNADGSRLQQLVLRRHERSQIVAQVVRLLKTVV